VSSKNQDLTKSSSNFESRPSVEEVFKPTYTNTKNELRANNLVSTEAKVAENVENSEKINANPFSKTAELMVQDSTLAEHINSSSTLESTSSFRAVENTAPRDSSDFMQFLNPPTKGLINSSKAKLISSSGEKAVFAIPEKFKFLKTKLEAKSEELIQALKQALNPEIKFIEVQIDSGSEKAYSKPLADLENDLSTSTSVGVNIPNNADMNLNINSVNASTEKDSKNSNDNCCDREAYLDEVLQAGVSIFGGNVVRD
jgi:hypothetical protein